MRIRLSEFIKLDKECLKGKVVCFPTDTVYGLGCMIDDTEGLKKIYAIKHRDQNKPLAVLTPSIAAIADYVKPYPKELENIITKYWPGALTVIFHKSNKVIDLVTSNLPTIGLRMPNSQIALKILNRFGLMATTSVNISNQPPLNNLTEIEECFGDFIDYYIDDKECLSEVSSTVIDVTSGKIKVLREGMIKF